MSPIKLDLAIGFMNVPENVNLRPNSIDCKE